MNIPPHSPTPVRVLSVSGAAGRESKFLLTQSHPEDSFTGLSLNKIQIEIQIRIFIHDSYLHTR
jgi:hypothetical protein